MEGQLLEHVIVMCHDASLKYCDGVAFISHDISNESAVVAYVRTYVVVVYCS